MFIRSGEQDTISMIKKFFFFFKSLKVTTFLTDVFCFALACVVLLPTTVSINRNNLIESKKKEVTKCCEEIARKIYLNAYLANQGENTGITRDMRTTADIYDGRIIIIDSNLRCITDTYDLETDKTLISTYVIDALNNTTVEYLDEDNRRMEIYYPISEYVSSKEEGLNGVIIFSFSISKEYEETDRLGKSLILIIIPVAVLVVVYSIWHSRRVSNAIKKVTNSIEHIREGYIDDRIVMNSFVELEEMTEAYNNLISRLQSVEDSRQEFVSNVSHELKTPLTSIKILADSLVMQPDAPPEVYREFLGDINAEIDRENRIITDLLELVKLDRKNGELHIATVSINEMLEILMKRLKPIAQAQNVDLIYESYRKVEAEVDEVKMMLAISNLIENAVKYNKEGGWVKVTLDSDHKYFTVNVSDNGIGIPEEAQKFIFDRFYRVDKMRARKTGGTGLGLSITKSVMLMHNGQLKVESKEGEGTTFTAKVPLSFVDNRSN